MHPPLKRGLALLKTEPQSADADEDRYGEDREVAEDNPSADDREAEAWTDDA